jgi:hypothetical protein
MLRLTAGIVAMAAIGAVVAGCGSSAAGPRPQAAAAVKATPRLKRRLEAEITTLRRAQPKAPLTPVRPLPSRPPVPPAPGATCFVSPGAGCSEVPCQEFARAPAVLKRSTTGVITRRAPASGSRTCRHAPRKLVLVSAP